MLDSANDEPCFVCAGNNIKRITYIRKMLETYNMNCFTGICFLDRLIVIVRHELDLAFVESTHKYIFYPESSLLHNDSCRYLTRFFIDV
jgi:hypothetical protein